MRCIMSDRAGALRWTAQTLKLRRPRKAARLTVFPSPPRTKSDAVGFHALERLHEQLFENRRDIVVATAPELADALDWLARHQRPGGFWGEEDDEGTTALCAIAVQGWLTAEAGTDETRAAAESVNLAATADWLEARVERGFSTPWYSAVNLRALCVLGRRGSKAASALAQRLTALHPENAQAWVNRGHHAAQIVLALRAYGTESDLRPWGEAMRRALEVENDVYVDGQMLYALLSEKAALSNLEEPLERLAGYLREKPLSKASFLEYAPAVLALGAVSSADPALEALTKEKTSELIRKYRETGWYGGPEYFAWSLMVLLESESRSEIVIDVATLNQRLSEAMRDQPAEQRRERRSVAFWAFVLGVDLTIAGFFTEIKPDSFLASTLIWGVLAGGTLLPAFKVLRSSLR